MELLHLETELRSNRYPGRGIVIGRTKDGTKAAAAYFIMGRSENSRNRIFVEDGEGIRTQAYDPAKLKDPRLILYAPVRVRGNQTIITNGDQTDTIFEGMEHQLTFEQSLRSRSYEPDAPNYTPRISGILHLENGQFHFALSILKRPAGLSGEDTGSDGQSAEAKEDPCERYTFAYRACIPGEGRFLHTYRGDAAPLPPFEGEPKRVAIPDTIDACTDLIWENLNEENKVSLFVRYLDLASGKYESRIVNKNH